MPGQPHPRWYTIPVRVGLVTFICTLLVFAVSLLLGIVGTVAVSAFRHLNPPMRIAYRHIAVPVALVSGAGIFIASLIIEIAHYRQSRTLQRIARVSNERQLKILN